MEKVFYPEVQRLIELRPRSRANAEAINRVDDPAMRATLVELALQGLPHLEMRSRIRDWRREQKAKETPTPTITPSTALKSLVRQSRVIVAALQDLSPQERAACQQQLAELQQQIAQMNVALGE